MQFALLSTLFLAAAVASAQNVTIQVGAESTSPGGVFQFIPNNVTASNGTVVTFVFAGAPGNHTVTQSTFANPCEPETGGFDSGWVSVPLGEGSVAEWSLTITDDSKPIWFYCKQSLPTPHCKSGMVGAINAPTTGNTISAFIAAAKNTTSSGQGVGFLVGIGASASAPVGPITSGISTFGAPTPGADSAIPSGTASGSGSAGSSGTASDSGSAAAPTDSSSSNGASHVAAGTVFAMIAAALGLVMA